MEMGIEEVTELVIKALQDGSCVPFITSLNAPVTIQQNTEAGSNFTSDVPITLVCLWWKNGIPEDTGIIYYKQAKKKEAPQAKKKVVESETIAA